ncbi:MAG: hypothetical protein HQL08_09250 [Nitrospirae bacterium]|nr:hypothetical protein [Nitrospirota bacterium]
MTSQVSSSYTAPIFSNTSYTGSSSGSSSTSSTSSSSTKKSSGTLGEGDFMTLLIAQLKNQDPLNPEKNSDFVAQLATFSSLDQQTKMNQTIQQTSAVSMIGMDVKDKYGTEGVVQSVSVDSTNGVQLSVSSQQTQSDGTTKTVTNTINYSDVSSVTYVNTSSSNTGSSSTTSSSTSSSSGTGSTGTTSGS